MLKTLDSLESKRAQTFSEYTDRVGDVSCCGGVDLHVNWLETQLQRIYEFTRDESRGELSARDIHELWRKTVEICDFLIDHLRMLSLRSKCTVSYDRMLDIRNAADKKASFHVCCE